MHTTDKSLKPAESPRDFEARFRPIADEIRGFIFRMIGSRADSEDLYQDVVTKAFERRATIRKEDAFRPWVFRIASTTCLDFLRSRTRWAALVQSEVEQECAVDDAKRQAVVDTTRAPEFAFDVNEHISFCFTCVGRSLPPAQYVALVLREFFGFSNPEAAALLGIGEGKLRHHLRDARKEMEGTFDGLCVLVSKRGICHQCSGFRQATREERRGPSLPVLDQGEDAWERRLEAARLSGVQDGRSQTLHELLFARVEAIESARCDDK